MGVRARVYLRVCPCSGVARIWCHLHGIYVSWNWCGVISNVVFGPISCLSLLSLHQFSSFL